MAAFKVGQRVRKVGTRPGYIHVVPIGTEGVIVAIGPPLDSYVLDADWSVQYVGFHSPIAGFSSCLVPLTDPKADEFIKRIKKLKPLHEEPIAPRIFQLAGRFGGSK